MKPSISFILIGWLRKKVARAIYVTSRFADKVTSLTSCCSICSIWVKLKFSHIHFISCKLSLSSSISNNSKVNVTLQRRELLQQQQTFLMDKESSGWDKVSHQTQIRCVCLEVNSKSESRSAKQDVFLNEPVNRKINTKLSPNLTSKTFYIPSKIV